MPLRCLDPTCTSIQSFDLTVSQWQTLEVENRKQRHLRMPCCSSQVTLRTSRLGTRFFAHKALGECTTGSETEAHLRLKEMAVAAARAHEWTAETEVAGTTPLGERWTADVLAQKGDRKVAVEIQWSNQSNDETLRRQDRYMQSGVRGVWLLRQTGFPVTRKLPAACIGGTSHHGFSALIPYSSQMSARDRGEPSRWHQSLSMAGFLDAVFGGRLKYGVPPTLDAIVSVRATFTECWRSHCRACTRILTGIDVTFGPNICTFSVPDLDKYPDLLNEILKQLPENLGIGRIKARFSQGQNRRYLSNGCIRCDALVGEHFEIYSRSSEETISTFPLHISQQWHRAIESHESYQAAWGVYGPPSTID